MKILLFFVMAALIAVNAFATGTVDSSVTSMIDSASATFVAIKAVLVTITLFVIGYEFVRPSGGLLEGKSKDPKSK